MSLAEVAEQNGLHRVGARPRFFEYLRDAWRRRAFAVTMARYKVEAANEGNRLGMAWVVLQPMLNAAVYGFIFGILQGGNKPPDYVPYLIIGVFLFNFFSHSMNRGAKSITGNQSLVQSLAFPRITLPLSIVLEEFFNLLPVLGVMLALLIALGHFPRPSWLLIIPLLAIYTLFNLGVALITARLTVHLRDLAEILPFLNRLLFYTSGVLFSVDKIFASHPEVRRLYDFHPLYQVLSIARGELMTSHGYRPIFWLYFTTWAILTFVVGLVFFWAAEERYGRND